MTAPPLRSRGWPTSLVVVLVAVAVLIVVVPHLVPVPISQDGAQNAYASFARSHLDDPVFAAHFDANQPVTAFGYALLFAGLEALLGWREALRLSLVVAALVWTFGWSAPLSRLPRRRPLALLVAATAFSWALQMGFLNYVLGVGLGMAAVAATPLPSAHQLEAPATNPTASPRRWLSFVSLCLAALACHPFGAQLATLGSFVAAQLAARRGQRLAALAAPLLAGIPTLAVTAWTYFDLDATVPLLFGSSARSDFGPGERVTGWAAYLLPGPPIVAAVLVAVAIVGLGSACLGAARRRRLRPIEGALVAIAIASAAAYLSTPLHGETWQFMAPRFVPPAVIAGMLLFPVERYPLRLATAAAGLVCAAALVTAATSFRAVAELTKPALAALGEDGDRARSGTLLPYVFASQRRAAPPAPRHLQPFDRLGLYYAMDRQRVTPYTFAWFPSGHVLTSRDALRAPSQILDPLRLEGAARNAALVRLGLYGSRYDELLVYGNERDWDELLAFGFETISRQHSTSGEEGVLLARFAGCPARLVIRAEDPIDVASFQIAYGWAGYDRPAWADETRQPRRLPAAITLPRSPCHPIWIRIYGLPCAEAARVTRSGVRASELSATPDHPDGSRLIRCTVAASSAPD